MAIALTALAASPTAVNPHGGQSTITPTLTGDTAQEITITGTDENGDAAEVTVTINAEVVVADVTATDIVNGKAPAGKIVYTLSNTALGTLAVGSGASVVFTAA